jgi:hypothetical protein
MFKSKYNNHSTNSILIIPSYRVVEKPWGKLANIRPWKQSWRGLREYKVSQERAPSKVLKWSWAVHERKIRP